MSGIIVTLTGSWGDLGQRAVAGQSVLAARLAERGKALMAAQIQANGQVNTGAMLESLYTTTPSGSGYGEAARAARSRNPKVQLLPDIGPAEPGTAAIALAAGHADAQNYGTVHQPARAFLEPALALLEDEQEQAIADFWEELIS